MISAKEAREQAFLMHHSHELEEIDRRVRSAVHGGAEYIYVGASLHSSTVEKLRQLGYLVELCSSEREPDTWLISWEKWEEEN